MLANPTLWSMLSNGLVFSGLVVAITTIRYNVKTARRSQTALFLFESRKDKEYLTGLQTLKRVRDSGKSFRSYIFPGTGIVLSENEMQERRKIQYILNFYERVAVSIKSGIYDEDMIKRTSFTTVIETYEAAEPLIKAIREYIHSELTYQEYEWLYQRWKQRPLKRQH